MEEDVYNALQTRTAFMPGGFDRDNKLIIIVNTVNDMQLWNRTCLELTITYIKRAIRPSLLQCGVSVIVDAQKCSSRITRTHARIIYALFADIPVSLYLVREEGFWEKHVETCTKSTTSISSIITATGKSEPIILSRARLGKYFDLRQLPEELGGTLVFNYDLWLHQRKAIDEFQKTYAQTLAAMEGLQVLLLANKKLRPSQIDGELKRCAEMHKNVQRSIEFTIGMGNNILTRLIEVYAPAPSLENLTAAAAATATAESENHHINVTNTNNYINKNNSSNSNSSSSQKPTMPSDLTNERECIEARLSKIERKQTKIRTAWLDLLRSIRETRELASLADGVLHVTNWILNTAEQLLSQQQAMGSDMRACEALRLDHNQLELECSDTYAFYAELLYKIDEFGNIRGDDCELYRDLRSQRDFMQFVCRAFATRLERRRNILITATRFFRLVNEYFERTTLVFESLVMVQNEHNDFSRAAGNLQKLKDNQESLAHLERELLKEGEKLSDMLSMPVKDALGRDLNIDYSDDIRNVKHILDATIIRRNIFSDSIELQKLTFEQLIHINTYEEDAQMATNWMSDLYNVMIKCHTHVGCNIYEIQVQKDELQAFQETGKSIYNYGSQLMDASQALRKSCNLEMDTAHNILQKLQHTWHCLLAISQEHMTRLRVSSVFHRSVDDYCLQLQHLRRSVRNLSKFQADYHSSHDMPSNEVAAVDMERGDQLRKYLYEREQLLLEVGRMVRLGRLLKLRLKEPFVLDAITGKSVDVEDLTSDTTRSINSNESAEIGQATLETPTGDDDSAVITVNPNGNNNMACEAVSQKLNEISEVAEQLDEAIRYAQLIINENMTAASSDILESNSNSSSSEKNKMEHLNSNSSEDWQSRSTEEDSFATASDGNFTHHSHSSSFQTASGRTSSHISSDKNSFDASDPDESTLSFDSPTAGSQHSLKSSHSALLQSPFADDKHSNDSYLHSESVTPTPNAHNLDSSDIVSESYMDEATFSTSNISNTEYYAPPITEGIYSNTNAIQSSSSLDLPSQSQCNNKSYDKPNGAWRHSKYYENINNNKQTIKGFL